MVPTRKSTRISQSLDERLSQNIEKPMPTVSEIASRRTSQFLSQSAGWQMNSQFLKSSKHCVSRSSQPADPLHFPSQKNGRKVLLKHVEYVENSTCRSISKKSKSNVHERWRINPGAPTETPACSSNPPIYGQDDQHNISALLTGNPNQDKSDKQKGHTLSHRSTRAGCSACVSRKDTEETNTHKQSKPDNILSSKPLFEVMNSEGCWWDVEILRSRGEKHHVHYVHFDSDEDEEVFSWQLRLRSRKATPWDCFHNLQPGMDITLFSVHPQASKRFGDNIRPFAAWYDAKVISIYKRLHNPDCFCKFVVQFYSTRTKDQIGDNNRTLLTDYKTTIGINKIGILQKPFESSLDDILAKLSSLKVSSPKLRWSSDTWSLEGHYAVSEDDNELFAAELEKMLSEDEVLTGNGYSRLIDHNLSTQHSKQAFQSPGLGFASYLENVLETDVHIDKETSSSQVEVSAGGIKTNRASLSGQWKGSRNQDSKPSKPHSQNVKRQLLPDELEYNSIKKVTHAQKKNVATEENNRTSSKHEFCISPLHEENDNEVKPKSSHDVKPKIEMTSEMKKFSKRKISSEDDKVKNEDKMIINSVRSDKAIGGSAEILGGKKVRKKRSTSEENTNAELEQWYDALFKGDLLQLKDRQRKKESKSEPPPNKDQRDAYFLWSNSLEDGLLDSQNTVIEADKEFGEIWQEMQIALHNESTAMMSKMVDQEPTFCSTENPAGCKNGHSFMFNEEEGLICESCGLIGMEIENMIPTLDVGTSDMRHRKVVCNCDNEDDEELSDSLFGKLAEAEQNRSTKSLSRILPHLKVQMHKHQEEGFNFLWKNIVGDEPDGKNFSMQNETGGCILSHAPGTGKSLLIISFLQSFLGINSSCKPLIVAPKIMLRPWQREFLKWKVDIPVYILNTEREYRKRMALEEDESGIVTLNNGARLPAKELGRIITLAQWHRQESVLLVSYSLFSSLIEHGALDGASKVSKKISEMLLQSPDLLILDEGHLPRNKDTKIRAALMKVQTKLRILLSGTVFQNNFEELFNTLYLVRPQFVELFSGFTGAKHGEFIEENEMILDAAPVSSRLKRRSNGRRSPKLFQNSTLHDEIIRAGKNLLHSEEAKDGRPIEVIEIDDTPLETPYKERPFVTRKVCRRSSRLFQIYTLEDEKLKSGVSHSVSTVEAKSRRLFMKTIGSKFDQSQREKSLQDGFQILRKLTDPFVHYYAGEVLQSLPGLHDFAVMLKPTPSQENLLQKALQKWDSKSSLELEMAVSAICIHPCLLAYLKYEEIQNMELSEFEFLRKDPEAGVKTMFVMELLRLCQCTSEKVLVFSEILSPFTLLEQILEESFGWVKGKETLRLDGKLSLDERQMIIDRINQPADCARVLFASIKACGEGITLTGASRVVFLHMVWNPSVMKQAVSRAFRLGQKRPVYVYRLVASGTMEEDKYKKTVWKDWLSRSIFVSQTFNEENWETINKDVPESLENSQDDDSLLYDACHDKMLEKLLENKKVSKSFQKIKHCSLFSEK
ncbi:hypothetical protein O6H91_Y044100 [Diphasiastrum complanatum]|nr:hypothetical protein O6H91_Y044100 [Diphasiastrum complanatum]KAJ7297652.1 hypothetical protein O6H91_Y044100 [Diphasiastrum complanatum]